MEAYAVEASPVGFAGSRGRFETVAAWLEGAESAALSHAELEARLEVESRELFRQLLQDHLDLRAQRERRLEEVVGADGLSRGSAEAGHQCGLATVFGEVQVRRIAYRRRGYGNLHPADGVLNLPTEKHLMGFGGWRPSRAHAARSRPRSRRSSGPRGSGWASGWCNNSLNEPPVISMTSTRSGPGT